MDQPIVIRKYRARSEGQAMEQAAADKGLGSYTMDGRAWSGASLARSIITPIILLIAGYLVAGQLGAIAGAVVGIVYLAYVIAAAKGTLTVTYRRR